MKRIREVFLPASMIIAIDASSAEKPQRTGVEEYAFQLIEYFKKMKLGEGSCFVFYSRSSPSFLAKEGDGRRLLRWPFKRFWMQGRVTWELWRRPPDVFFVPAQALPFFVRRKIKVVTTIHDIGFLCRSDLYSKSEVRRQEWAVRRAIKRADTIFTPSEFTKSELIERCRVPLNKIVVIPLAADKFFVQRGREEVEPILDKYRLGYKNYFLFIGRIEAKKNVAALIPAFEEFKKQMGAGDPVCLVFAGPPGFCFEEVKKQYEQSSFKEMISLLGFLPREDLPGLVAGALALVAPNWYEGFGLPPLEAAACGTPVIASDISVHREVMDEVALFVRPEAPEQWAAALVRAVREPALLSELSTRGLARAKNFSWEETARKTFEYLWRP